MDRQNRRQEDTGSCPLAHSRAGRLDMPMRLRARNLTLGSMADGSHDSLGERGPESRVEPAHASDRAPSLQDRARRIREIKSLSRQETSQRITEDITLWMREIFAIQEKA